MSGNGVSPVDAHLVVRYAPQERSGSDRAQRRRSSIQGTSICVTEPWLQEESEEDANSEYGATSESRGSGRLSASLRVCDLYQCVHQHSSATLHPQLYSGSSVTRPASQTFNTSANSLRYRSPTERSRRFSDTESDLAGLGAHFLLDRASSSFSNDPTSVAAASTTAAAAAAASRSPHFEELAWRIPSRSRQSSLSSSSQASSGIGPTSATSDHADIQDLRDDEHGSHAETRGQNADQQSHQDCWVDLSNPCCRHHHRRNSTAIKFRKALYEEE
ncbi:LAFA_0F14246g1_1 [Lachancea sp. 'fantastica']|nr:LAFA_0F14246g1_1 [Lachancea sp. 'fantastica']